MRNRTFESVLVIIMCYRILERYSACGCLYDKHPVDECGAAKHKLHMVQERTILVGHLCPNHSSPPQSIPLWTDLTAMQTNRGVSITSEVALKKLKDAQLMDDGDTSTGIFDESVRETPSAYTTVENDPRHETKPQNVPNHTSNLNDFRTRLCYPYQYITSLQDLEQEVWKGSAISLFTDNLLLKSYETSYGVEKYIPYPLVPSELHDLLPYPLSDDPLPMESTSTSDKEITALCQDTKSRTLSSYLNTIRICRNVVLRAFLNLKTLQRSNLCAGCFSIIVLDKRRRNVAQLLPIEMTDFITIVYELEYILRDSATLVLEKAPLDIDSQLKFLDTPMVKKYCQEILQANPDTLIVPGLGVVGIFFEIFGVLFKIYLVICDGLVFKSYKQPFTKQS